MSFERRWTVEWGDCDEAGIVYYPNYFYWFDSTFQAWLRQLALGQRQLRERWQALTPLVDVGAEFRAPLRYDDDITIRVSVARWQERSFRLDYTVRQGARQRLVAVGHEERAWVRLAGDGTFRSELIAAEFRQRLEDAARAEVAAGGKTGGTAG